MMSEFGQGDDPHGVQKLLALLRTQQQQQGENTVASASPSASSVLVKTPLSSSHSERKHPSSAIKEDYRYISFAQALPHLTRLAKDDKFLAALLRLKDEQDHCEERLAREREDFSKSRMNRMDSSTSSALAAWDREALRRWDMLHHEQQRQLQIWGVPCFFETDEPKHLKKQARVFDVLFGLLE